MRVFEAVLGWYYIRVEKATLETGKRQKGAHSADLMSLKGKYLAVCSEFDQGIELSSNFIKEVIGADGLQGRACYGKEMEKIDPSFKLVLLTNKLPQMNFDQNTTDKLRVIPFNARFVDNPDPKEPHQYQRDPNFWDKVKTPEFVEAAFVIFMHGYQLLKSEGEQVPDEVKVEAEKYAEKVNKDMYMVEFVDDAIERLEETQTGQHGGSHVKVTEVQQHFQKWIEWHKYDPKLFTDWFKRGAFKAKLESKTLAELLPEKRQFKIQKSGAEKVRDIKLKYPWCEDDVLNI